MLDIAYIDNDKEFQMINKINDKIYLGNEDASADYETLKECGISHVLVCAKEPKKIFIKEFVYKQFMIDDYPEQNIIQFFKEAFSFIDSAKIVFVHCQAGVSRSASFVIGYLMWKLKKSFEEIFCLVKVKRMSIDPNDGFIKQLKMFDQYLVNRNYKINNKDIKNQIKFF